MCTNYIVFMKKNKKEQIIVHKSPFGCHYTMIRVLKYVLDHINRQLYDSSTYPVHRTNSISPCFDLIARAADSIRAQGESQL